MVRSISRSGLVVALLLSFSFIPLYAQKNPRDTARFDKGGQFVMIEYGRPSLKGRDLLGQLQPGKTWRMGADKSTTFTCSSDLSLGKVTIPAGSYSLWLRKLEDKRFELLFNKTTGQWGTEHDITQDVAAVPLSLTQGTEKVEQFTINFREAGKGAELQLLWDVTVLKVPFNLK